MTQYIITIIETPGTGRAKCSYAINEVNPTPAETEAVNGVDKAFRAWVLRRTGRRPDDEIDRECREIAARENERKGNDKH